MDENSTPDDNIYINASDGLSNDTPQLHDDEDEEDGFANDELSIADDETVDGDAFRDLPKSLIVTNIHADVFGDPALKAELEHLFRIVSDSATFQWLKSFRRLRVTYDSGVAAATARIQLHNYAVAKSHITCYFAQPVEPIGHRFLKPPAPFKQFLISPPASPPAGWEPRAEGEPLVNHDLLAALANLMPGESHRLHEPQTPEHPAIIVHTAMMPSVAPPVVDRGDIHEDEFDDERDAARMRVRIPQTKCPERSS